MNPRALDGSQECPPRPTGIPQNPHCITPSGLSGLSFSFERKDSSPQRHGEKKKESTIAPREGASRADDPDREVTIEKWLGRVSVVACVANYALGAASLLIKDWPSGDQYFMDFLNALVAYDLMRGSQKRYSALKGESVSSPGLIYSINLPSRAYRVAAIVFGALAVCNLGLVVASAAQGRFTRALHGMGLFLMVAIISADAWQNKKVQEKKEGSRS